MTSVHHSRPVPSLAQKRRAFRIKQAANSELWLVAAVTALAALAIVGCAFVLAVLWFKA